jgi:hypothetical protein
MLIGLSVDHFCHIKSLFLITFVNYLGGS